MFQAKVVAKTKTHYEVVITCLFESRIVYERYNNPVEQGRPEMTILCVRTVCLIRKATNAYS